MRIPALATLALAAPAFAGPDFITPERSTALAASDAHHEEQPADDVVFTYDSSALSPTAQLQLASVKKWLADHPDYRLVLEGHADSSGPAAYNADLAARRLEITRNHLIDLGVNADRLVVAIYGENGARAPADQVDRRVILFASRADRATLVAAELDRNAIEASWSQHGTLFHQTRGITPVATVSAGRKRPASPHGG